MLAGQLVVVPLPLIHVYTPCSPEFISTSNAHEMEEKNLHLSTSPPKTSSLYHTI